MFRYSPNEILAVRAERGLLEEARDEAMILDIIDVLLLQRSLAAAVPHRELVLVLGHLVQGVLLLGHDDDGFFSSPRRLLCKILHSRQIHSGIFLERTLTTVGGWFITLHWVNIQIVFSLRFLRYYSSCSR